MIVSLQIAPATGGWLGVLPTVPGGMLGRMSRHLGEDYGIPDRRPRVKGPPAAVVAVSGRTKSRARSGRPEEGPWALLPGEDREGSP